MIAAATFLLFAQYDPLPPPPPPEPGQPFQPAHPTQHPAAAEPRPAPPAYQPAPRPAPEPYVKPSRPAPPPQSHRGFQLALRSGVALPGGSLAESSPMARLAAAQIPLFLDIGAKITRHVFLGGYASFGLGAVSDRWDRERCSGNDCNTRSVHVGAQLQYHFAPADRANPWLGYGIGYEWLWTRGYPETTYRGPEYGRFMAGVDFRLSRELGLGPFADATFARYTAYTYEQDFRGGAAGSYRLTETNDIANPSLHTWVTVGLRLVLYP